MRVKRKLNWRHIKWYNAARLIGKAIATGLVDSLPERKDAMAERKLYLVMSDGHVHSTNGRECFGTILNAGAHVSAYDKRGQFVGDFNRPSEAVDALIQLEPAQIKNNQH